MTTNLYEILEIPPDASPEDIRKAYKRRALQTHPDRLSPNATPAEKANSEDRFRKVNNAYEVLIDPTNRRLYDQHGVWPPPEPQRTPSAHHSQSGFHRFRSPQRASTYPYAQNDFQFTDPFVIFDRMFGDFNRSYGGRTHWDENPSAGFHSHFADLFAALERDFFSDFDDHHHFGSSSMFGRSLFPPPFHSFPAIAPPPFGQGGFASSGFYSQTINGVTHSVHKKRNWDGTEEEVRTYPDGRKVHTINGIEQPSSSKQFFPPSNPPPAIGTPSTSRHRHSSNAPPPPSMVTNHRAIEPAPAPNYQTPFIPIAPAAHHSQPDSRHSFNPPPPSVVTSRHAVEPAPVQNYHTPFIPPAPPSHHSQPDPFIPPLPPQESHSRRRKSSHYSRSPSGHHSQGHDYDPVNVNKKPHHWWSRHNN